MRRHRQPLGGWLRFVLAWCSPSPALPPVSPALVPGELGHANTAITADLYQHVLPAIGADAADQVAAIIDG